MDALDVYLTFLLIGLLRQPCETFPEVVAAGASVARLAVEVL